VEQEGRNPGAGTSVELAWEGTSDRRRLRSDYTDVVKAEKKSKQGRGSGGGGGGKDREILGCLAGHELGSGGRRSARGATLL